MDCDVLTLAGLWNSGPQHWQTLWEKKYPAWQRAPHRDWNNPEREEWVAELDAAIAGSDQGPPILVAHSLACALVAHWAASGSSLKIAGAFLVAPSDVEAALYPKEASGFAPMPMQKLPFPSIVVASENDEYVTIERARQFAAAWGSKFVEIGAAGHINGASGFGAWPEGEKMLLEFCKQLGK
ncbi:alpha/beta hydrolase [Massilia sp. R2A-15]|uniref:RBBP9/YdeN family alpha/beta hydrolase n=1 Tax=Massilia sp. R2A-15 TaxID=3064278 RepID=UPI00273553CC|nr:alpha/beta hydrolase [Massilia sp. R2A-15]WLI87429.1 alpha/beta hydrolase [Massilia sp. R2A-15]